MNPLNYLKAVLGAVSASMYPLVDYLVGLIPNIPPVPHTSLDVLIMALLTGGVVYGAPNQNQPSLSAGQVVVASNQTTPGANIIAVHTP